MYLVSTTKDWNSIKLVTVTVRLDHMNTLNINTCLSTNWLCPYLTRYLWNANSSAHSIQLQTQFINRNGENTQHKMASCNFSLCKVYQFYASEKQHV